MPSKFLNQFSDVYTILNVMHDAWIRQGSVLRLSFRYPHDFSFSVRCFCGRGCRSGGMGALDFDMLPEVTDIPLFGQNLLPIMLPRGVYTTVLCAPICQKLPEIQS